MRRVVVLFLVLICALAAVAGAPQPAFAKRVALVVGIDAYQNLEPDKQLRKAVNDARAMADAFRGIGYEVATAENVSRLDFLRNWSIFLNGIEPGDEVAFFFAGHGIEIARQNFLLPGDAPVVKAGEEQVMRASAIAMGELLDQLREKEPRVSLTIIDACRDNPFNDGRGRSIGGTRGLSRIDPPRGSFVMFSAAAGETSLDRLGDADSDPNSVYTRSLLPRLRAPGARIVDIARLVRQDVVEVARKHAHVQTPAYFDELVGDFCPAGCEAIALTPQPAPAPSPAPPPAAAPPAGEPEIAAVDPAPAPPAPLAVVPAGPSRELEEDGLFWSVAFSPDGKRLATGTHEKRVVVFDLETSAVIHRLEGHTELIQAIAISPDGRLVASGSHDKTIRLWDLASGDHVRTLLGHEHWVTAVAFSPDGATLASGSADNSVRLWDVATGALRQTLNGHANTVEAVMFTPNDRLLVSADAVDNVRVHEYRSGLFVQEYDLAEHTLSSAALAPDGSFLVTGHFTKKLKLWDGELKLSGERTDFTCDVDALAVSLQNVIASVCDNRVQLWTRNLDRPMADWTETLVTRVAFSPDGNTLAVVGGKVLLINVGDKVAGR